MTSSLSLLPTLAMAEPTWGAPALAVAIALPVIVALVIALVPNLSDRAVRNFARFGSVVPAVLAIALAMAACTLEVGAWSAFRSQFDTGLGRLGIFLDIGLNGLQLPLFLLAAIVGAAAGWYAASQEVARPRLYLALVLVMQTGLLGVFASNDVLWFYLFHEVAMIPTFLLIAIWGGHGRKSAAYEMAIFLTLGAMLSLLGLLALRQVAGGANTPFTFDALREAIVATAVDGSTQTWIYGLLLFGFGILVSLWPLHSWAPRGYGAAPTPAAMLHAGVLKKFGLFGLLQLGAPLLPQGAEFWRGPLVWLALGNVLVIGFVTLAQRNLKQMIGYSSVMHMGYLFLALATASALGAGAAVLLMVAHGLSTAALFLLAHHVQRRTGTFEMTEMGGLARSAPVLAALFVAATMASVGLPGFGNFWGEILVFLSLQQSDGLAWATVPAVAGIVISALYGLRAAARIFFGEPSAALQEVSRTNPPSDLSLGDRLPVFALLAALLVVGVWPRSITDGVQRALAGGALGAEVAAASAPALAGGVPAAALPNVATVTPNPSAAAPGR